jgi:hypothetical protein
VVVSNNAGTATSNNATLSVIVEQPPPVDELRDPDDPSNVINGLDYSYYHGTWSAIPDFAALRKEDVGYVTNFDLSPREEHDNFGFRFTGYISIPADGIYSFFTSSNEGSKLYIGTEVIVNNDGLHGVAEKSGQIGLKAGKHQITVDYFERSMQQVLTASYQGPGLIKQLIPDEVLYRQLPDLLVINPVADAYVRSGNYDHINLGPGPALSIGKNGDNYETYLRFDISSVRTGLSSAKLRLYGGLDGTNTAPVTVEVFNVNEQGWLEQTITFNNKPVAQNIVLASATINVGPDQYYEWDLADHIIDLRNSGALYVSLRVKTVGNTSNTLFTFNSKENAGNKPELKIEYDPLIVQQRSETNESTITKGAQNKGTASTAGFSIYPNPVANSFTLTYSPEFKKKKLQLADVNGKLIKEIQLTESGIEQIRVDDLKEGMYFLYMESNKKRYSRKMVISK